MVQQGASSHGGAVSRAILQRAKGRWDGRQWDMIQGNTDGSAAVPPDFDGESKGDEFDDESQFGAGSGVFSKPKKHQFNNANAAANATEPTPRGEAGRQTGRAAASGVAVGNVGSYGFVQHLEKTGDKLTGDHQPSGAAVKEAIRQVLHTTPWSTGRSPGRWRTMRTRKRSRS